MLNQTYPMITIAISHTNLLITFSDNIIVAHIAIEQHKMPEKNSDPTLSNLNLKISLAK